VKIKGEISFSEKLGKLKELDNLDINEM